MKINKLDEKKSYILIFVIIISISSYLLIYNSFIYGLSDAYYYNSLASSLFDTGYLFDTTLENKQAIVSTQNGIVFIHYSLMKLGMVDAYFRMEILSYINIIFLLYIVYIIKKILVEILYTDKRTAYTIILIFSLTPEVYTSMLQPINDIYFTLLSLLFIYIMFSNKIDIKYKFLILFIISMVINHFRIQGVFLFIPIIIISLFLKQYKETAIYIIFLVLSLLSVKLVNAVIINDFTGIENLTNLTLSSISIISIYESFINIINYTLPTLFFSTNIFSVYYSFIFYILVIYFLFFAYKSIVKEKSIDSYIFLLIGANILFISLFLVQEARYLISIYPFLLYVIFKYIKVYHFHNTYIIILLLILIFRFALSNTLYSFDRINNINFNVDYSINKLNAIKFKKDLLVDYDLVSENRRTTYFFLDKANVLYYNATKENIVYIGKKKNFYRLVDYMKKSGYIVFNVKNYQYPLLIKNGLYPDSDIFFMSRKRLKESL